MAFLELLVLMIMGLLFFGGGLIGIFLAIKLLRFPFSIGAAAFASIFALTGLNAVIKAGKGMRLLIDPESQMRKAGKEGEKQVAYALRWLDKNRFKTFSNIRLSTGGEPQEFDNIVVGDYAIFNIETKNYAGDIIIDEAGNWYRVSPGGKKKGMQNPAFQVKRHRTVLNGVLKGKLPIVDLIVWANEDSVIEGIQNSLVKLIKVDQLTYFIDSYKEGPKLSEGQRKFAIRAIERSAVSGRN